MLNRNILRDIFTCKKNIGIVLISDYVQAIMTVLSSLIIAFLANAMLFSQLDETAVPFMALLFFFLCIRGILSYTNRLQVEKISLATQTKLRSALLAKLAENTRYGNDLTQARWVALITKGVDKLDVYINNFLPQLGILTVTPLTLLAFAFYMDWISALIFLFTAPLIPGFMILIGKMAKSENEKQWAVFQKLSAFMVDFLPGLLVLKAFNQAEVQLQRLQEKGEAFSRTTLKVLRVAFLSAFMLELISTLSIAVIAVNIGLRLIYGDGFFFPLMFILLIAPQFYNPLRQFGSAFHDGMNGLTAAQEIYEVVDSKPLQTPGNDVLAKDLPLDIKVEGISFNYDSDKEEVLKDVSFTVPFGQQAVITGPNGSGKSTFFKLLLKLILPGAGKIYVQGKDIQQLETEAYYREIGYIPQSPHIFTASVRENIAMGRDVSPQQLAKVLEQVNLRNWVDALPQGVDTVLAKGMKVSSGQLRRIGLARALVLEPRLLLLDEPMENLDPANEELIQSILRQLKGRATVLIIGHRRQTLLQADRILYLEQGKLCGSGTREQVLASGILKEVYHV